MAKNKPLTMEQDLDPELVVPQRIKDNFIIAIVKRNGGHMEFPVAEIDAANDLLEMHIDSSRRVFVLKTMRRQ